MTGYDSSPEMLRVARQAAEAGGLSRVGFVRASLDEGLPAEDGRFDLLTCALVLCHVPDIRAAVRECARLVRPGGHLLLTDFHPAAIAWGWRTGIYGAGGTLPSAQSGPQPGRLSPGSVCRRLHCAGRARHRAGRTGVWRRERGGGPNNAGGPPLCLTLPRAQKSQRRRGQH